MRIVETLMIGNDLKAKLSHAYFKNILVQHLLRDAKLQRNRDEEGLRVEVINKASDILSNSSMYFVKSEMTDLITFAGEKLDEGDILDYKLAPTKQGFVYFEKPIPCVDNRGVTLSVNMALWWFDKYNDLYVLKFNDQYRTPDEIAIGIIEKARKSKDKNEKAFVEEMGRFGFIGLSVHKNRTPIGQTLHEPHEEVIKFYESTEGFTPVPSANFIRTLHAYWLMMNQTLIKLSKEEADKKLARTMKRFNMPTEVTIVQYRRVETDKEYSGESSVEWSHRWIVRGHWRWQPYKTIDGKDDVKRIWIAPFMKGPEDKPLILTDKIYALVQ